MLKAAEPCLQLEYIVLSIQFSCALDSIEYRFVWMFQVHVHFLKENLSSNAINYTIIIKVKIDNRAQIITFNCYVIFMCNIQH